MKVTVDHDKCEGHARCVQFAPEVFEIREDDKSYVLVDEVSEAQRPKVEQAVKFCPRQAIAIS